MKNRLQQRSRVAVSNKVSNVKYIAGGVALALIAGMITFAYLNFGHSENSKASDNDTAWFVNFGTGTGTLSSGTSTTFLPIAPSGTAQVVANRGGSFILQNPGLPNFGTGSELKVAASDGNNPVKFSVVDYQAGKSFYIKYSVRWEGGTDGEWIFAVGDGSAFSDINASNFPNNQVFTAFKTTYTSTGLNMSYMSNSWSNFPAVSGGINKNTTYTFEVYGNNSTSTIDYKYGSTCTSKSIASNKMDIYINGAHVGVGLNKSGLSNDAMIDSYMFSAYNSTNNAALFYLDDIIYLNKIPLTTIQPISQPTNLSFSNVGTTTINLSFSAANNTPDGYLILRKSHSAPTTPPSDLTDYAVGSLIGDATVAYVGPNNFLNETGLSAGTHYYYSVYSYYGSGNCKNYMNLLPLSGSQHTHFDEIVAAFRSIVAVGSWTTASNWEYEYLPGLFKRATIFPTFKNKSITIQEGHKITSSNLIIDNLFVEKGSTLAVNGDLTVNKTNPSMNLTNFGTIQISGNFNLSGKMNNNPGSVIELSSSGISNVPSGEYASLRLSNNGAKVLKGDITVKESLTLNKSSIKTENFTVNLSSEATLAGESNNYYVSGKLKTVKAVTRNRVDFGEIGVIIDASENQESLGSVTIIRTTNHSLVVGSNQSVGRNWSIEPEQQPIKAVSVTLKWAEIDEDIPMDLSKIQVWKSTDKGVTWNTIGELQEALSRSITVSTPSFSDWTVAQGVSQLPVKLRSFSGLENNFGTATLNWVTSEELNNEGFHIEKSLDGKSFKKVGFVKGVGNSAALNSYQFKDETFTSNSYYRLRQVDFNGDHDFSSIVYVEKKGTVNTKKIFGIYPNPVIDHVSITTTDDNVSDNINVTIFTSKGKEMFGGSGDLEEINTNLSRVVSNWPEDIYIIDVKSNGKSERLKMIKKR